MSGLDEFKYQLQSGRLSFLIGSGLSCPFFSTLGDIERRLEELSNEPESDAKEIVRASIIREYFEKCISKNYELANDQFEDNEKDTLKNYQEFLNNINKIVLLRKSNLLSKQINLFTTNVDIFLEKALESQRIEFNDGFTGRLSPAFELSNFKKSLFKTSPHYDNKSEVPIFNLFKVHGSVTWCLEDNVRIGLDNELKLISLVKNSISDMPSNSFISVTEEIDNKTVFRTIADLISEASSKDFSEKEKIDELIANYEKFVIINPSKEKFKFTTLNYTYYELLRMFSNELERENSILFVMGFSFADEHIKEIVLRALNSNPTLIICVFAYNSDAKNEIRKNLGFEGVEPKNSNLKFIDLHNEDTPYNLKNINELYFSELSKSLTKNNSKKPSSDISEQDNEQ